MTLLTPTALALLLGSGSYAAREHATAELLARLARPGSDPVALAVLGSPLGVSSPDAEVRCRAEGILARHWAAVCRGCGGTGWARGEGQVDAAVAMKLAAAGMEGSGVACGACKGKGKPGS